MTQPVLLTTGVAVDPQMTGLPVDDFGAAADAAAACLSDARRRSVELAGHVPGPDLLGALLTSFYSGRGPRLRRSRAYRAAP